jgi:hypothetical protein
MWNPRLKWLKTTIFWCQSPLPLSSGGAGDNQASDGGMEGVIISYITNVVKSQIQIHPINQPFGGNCTVIDWPLFLGLPH